MTEDFDREMDVLLRQAAQGEAASENSRFEIRDSKFEIQNSILPHLDADEISLFAENALPKTLRENAVIHFADCDRCRKILSDLIPQNSEKELVSAAEQPEISAPKIPWHRKIFAFPNLAYTLGALVIVFSGIVALTVLQTVNNSRNAEVSGVFEPSLKGGPFFDDTAIVAQQNANMMMSANSMSNAAMSNMASSSNAMLSNAAASSPARNSAANSPAVDLPAATKPSVSANEPVKEQEQTENEINSRQISELPINGRAASNLALQKQESKKKADKSETDETATVSAPPSKSDQVTAGAENDSSAADSTKNSTNSFAAQLSSGRRNSRRADKEIVETKKVGEKTFERRNNSWVDSIYKNQATTDITRGTKEYKKLDSGLRSIVENLGGTIIIVWKEKAYRIQ